MAHHYDSPSWTSSGTTPASGWQQTVSARNKTVEKTFTREEIIKIINSLDEVAKDEFSWDDFTIHKNIYVDKNKLIEKFKV